MDNPETKPMHRSTGSWVYGVRSGSGRTVHLSVCHERLPSLCSSNAAGQLDHRGLAGIERFFGRYPASGQSSWVYESVHCGAVWVVIGNGRMSTENPWYVIWDFHGGVAGGAHRSVFNDRKMQVVFFNGYCKHPSNDRFLHP